MLLCVSPGPTQYIFHTPMARADPFFFSFSFACSMSANCLAVAFSSSVPALSLCILMQLVDFTLSLVQSVNFLEASEINSLAVFFARPAGLPLTACMPVACANDSFLLLSSPAPHSFVFTISGHFPPHSQNSGRQTEFHDNF